MATWSTCRPLRWGMGIGTRREHLHQVRALVRVPPSSITSSGQPAPRRSQSPDQNIEHNYPTHLRESSRIMAVRCRMKATSRFSTYHVPDDGTWYAPGEI